MSTEEFNELRDSLPNYIGCWEDMTAQQKQLSKELDCISMINSALVYSSSDTWDNSNDFWKHREYRVSYAHRYIEALGLKRVQELFNGQVYHFKNNCEIIENVATDSDGINYNSFVELV